MSCNWQKVRLGDVCEIQTGPFGSQLHNEDYVTVGTPIVTVEHLGQRKFSLQNLPRIKEKDKQRLIKYVLKKDDIVFSRVGSVDRCSYVSANEDGWLFSGRCLRVRCLDKIIRTKYLYYYFCLEKIRQHIRNIAVGATMPSINTKLLQSIEVELPPLAEQERIAAILGSLDDKIELNNRINKNLEEQAQALFKRWFVDFEFPDANGKPYKLSGGAFKDSELGLIPEEWSINFLSELTSLITRGITPKYSEEEPEIVLNQKCIRNHEVSFKDSRLHMPKQKTDKWLKYGDILINSTGQGTLGRVAQYLYKKKNVTVDSHITIVRPAVPLFIYYLGCDLLRREKEIEFMASGSTGQTELSRVSVQNIQLATPNMSTLVLFNELINPIITSRISLIVENNKLEKLRDLLLPKLMDNKL